MNKLPITICPSSSVAVFEEVPDFVEVLDFRGVWGVLGTLE